MMYREVVPVGEVINGVRVLKRVKKKLNSNPRNESVYECECTLCGRTVYRLASMIISGALLPCNNCMLKYKLLPDKAIERINKE